MIKRGNMQKKAAFELSMTTVVIIVLAMTMLILGLTLVRKVMKMGTGVIDITDAGVRDKLNKLLGEEGRDVTIGLPAKTAVGRPGGDIFNAPVVVNTQALTGVVPKDLKYIVTLDKNGECIKKNGEQAVKGIFKGPIGESIGFDEWEADAAYATIIMQIPKGIKLCTQKVYIDVKAGTSELRTSFTLEVARASIF